MWEDLPQTWAAPASRQMERVRQKGDDWPFVRLAFPLAAELVLPAADPNSSPGTRTIVSSLPSLTVQEPSRLLVPTWGLLVQ